MIDFQRLQLNQKEQYQQILFSVPNRGCEYSFANLYLWGHQQVAFLHGCVAFFSHFFGRSVYPYPIGNGDRRAVLEEILQDSRQRGIPCRITGILPADWEELDRWFVEKVHCRACGLPVTVYEGERFRLRERKVTALPSSRVKWEDRSSTRASSGVSIAAPPSRKNLLFIIAPSGGVVKAKSC